jgi:hypothetical protein
MQAIERIIKSHLAPTCHPFDHINPCHHPDYGDHQISGIHILVAEDENAGILIVSFLDVVIDNENFNRDLLLAGVDMLLVVASRPIAHTATSNLSS